MASRLKLKPAVVALAAAATVSSWAQNVPATLAPMTITGKAEPVLDVDRAQVSGFGTTLAKTPQSVTVLSADLITLSAAQSLSDLLRLDASLNDNYNTTGYIESLSVRGFVLDQGNNFSRNGLATSNYVPLALESLERIEVLKGVAGLQAGVSAPGGLVNYVSKVPLKQAFTSVTIGADGQGGSKAHLDSNTTLGGIGVRLNLVDEQLHPQFEQANGSRQLLSLALAKALSADTSFSANLQAQRKSQPSVPGLGLLDANGDGIGDTLPAVSSGRLNLNNQSWSLPFQVASSSAQVALNQRLNTDWSARLSAGTQSSRINDRIAFPDGCSSAANYVYPGLCGNGDVDIYDYRSEGERRGISSWDAQLNGKFTLLARPQTLRLGLSGRSAFADLPAMQAYNWVGISNIFAPLPVPADPTLTYLNSNSREHALDAYTSLRSQWSESLQTFIGTRTSRLNRSSERSDGSQAVSFEQTVSTPWAGVTWSANTSTLLYASWGQGVELEVVPNRPLDYANYGQILPALKSKQTELGLKWQADARLLFTAAVFNIDKPYTDDVAGSGALPDRLAGAKAARHRGIELAASGRVDEALSLQASLMALDAKYTQASDSSLIGQHVTNIPRLKGSVFANYKVAALPGLSLNALASFEGSKTVNADGSVALPSSWQLDGGVSYQQRSANKTTTWRFNVENLTDRRYWREAPGTDWGGVYLFAATPRTVRLSVTFDFQ